MNWLILLDGSAHALAYLGMCMLGIALYVPFLWGCYSILDAIEKRLTL